MAITRAEFTINDLNDIVAQPTPPTNPAVGMLWQNTSVNPNELLSWTGKGTQTDRRYAASKAGASVLIEDLSDNRALGVLVKTVAKQPTGTPTLVSPLALTGYDKLIMRQPKNRNLMPPLMEVKASYGVTFTPSAVSASILVTGTSTNAINFALVGAWNSGVPLYWLKAGTYTLKQSSPDVDIRLVSNTTTLARASAPTFTLAADTPITAVFAVIAAGKTLNTTINFQIEEGTASTAYIKYDAVITEVTPLSTLWGIAGYEDRWGNGGGEQHYTGYASLHGSESGWYESTGNAGANTRLYAVPLIATTPQASSRTLYPGIVSNRMVDRGEGVWASGAYADTGSVCALHAPANSAFFNLYIRVPTSLAADLAAFKIWLASNPIQVAYRKETPDAGVYGAPVQINGFEGANVITSDGSSVQVEYTGTGWANVGAPERLDIENVSISKEQGLRVDTILISEDGTQQIPTYFNARGSRYGLFRQSDGKLINGAKALSSGRAIGITEALAHPDAPDGTMFLMELRNYLFNLRVGGSTLTTSQTVPGFSLSSHLSNEEMGGQFDMSIEPISGIVIKMRTIYSRHFLKLASFTGNDLDMERGGGIIMGQLPGDGTRIVEVIGDYFAPNKDNETNLGTSSLRYKKVYSASSTISTSDEREKHDIKPLDVEMLTRFLTALTPIEYRLNAIPEERHFGYGAQAFKAAMDTAGIPADFAGYDGSNPDHLGLCYGEMTAIHTAIIQKQQAQIESQQQQIDALGAQIEEIKGILAGKEAL